MAGGELSAQREAEAGGEPAAGGELTARREPEAGALSDARRDPAKRRRARELRSAWLYFALSLAVSSITVGAFLSGFERFAEVESGLYAAGWLLVWAIVFRFPRSVGVPAVFLVLTASLALPVIGESWYFLRGEEYVARVRILNVGEDRVEAEWRSAAPGLIAESGSVFQVDGSSPAAGVRVIRIPQGVFFLAADALIRVETVEGYTRDGETLVSTGSVRRYEGPEGVFRWLDEYLIAARIPRFDSRLETAMIRRPVILSEYVLEAHAIGEVSFVPAADAKGN